ncbi:hypothetical protein KIN20_017671 [Parelaphostrongylus tenuis]|uniref:Uncharacterized protein n=1 Tax=Parelaphostrongylus tenuis TaxID=148309 RepID=A0AAD5MI90_PARTN|nr:hypothetical protein KIN20_017671 [Parelaphostrongylus tenuis]
MSTVELPESILFTCGDDSLMVALIGENHKNRLYHTIVTTRHPVALISEAAVNHVFQPLMRVQIGTRCTEHHCEQQPCKGSRISVQAKCEKLMRKPNTRKTGARRKSMHMRESLAFASIIMANRQLSI